MASPSTFAAYWKQPRRPGDRLRRRPRARAPCIPHVGRGARHRPCVANGRRGRRRCRRREHLAIMWPACPTRAVVALTKIDLVERGAAVTHFIARSDPVRLRRNHSGLVITGQGMTLDRLRAGGIVHCRQGSALSSRGRSLFLLRPAGDRHGAIRCVAVGDRVLVRRPLEARVAVPGSRTPTRRFTTAAHRTLSARRSPAPRSSGAHGANSALHAPHPPDRRLYHRPEEKRASAGADPLASSRCRGRRHRRCWTRTASPGAPPPWCSLCSTPLSRALAGDRQSATDTSASRTLGGAGGCSTCAPWTDGGAPRNGFLASCCVADWTPSCRRRAVVTALAGAGSPAGRPDPVPARSRGLAEAGAPQCCRKRTW